MARTAERTPNAAVFVLLSHPSFKKSASGLMVELDDFSLCKVKSFFSNELQLNYAHKRTKQSELQSLNVHRKS